MRRLLADVAVEPNRTGLSLHYGHLEEGTDFCWHPSEPGLSFCQVQRCLVSQEAAPGHDTPGVPGGSTWTLLVSQEAAPGHDTPGVPGGCTWTLLVSEEAARGHDTPGIPGGCTWTSAFCFRPSLLNVHSDVMFPVFKVMFKVTYLLYHRRPAQILLRAVARPHMPCRTRTGEVGLLSASPWRNPL